MFTPTNITNYTSATGSVMLLVNKASTTTKITSATPNLRLSSGNPFKSAQFKRDGQLRQAHTKCNGK